MFPGWTWAWQVEFERPVWHVILGSNAVPVDMGNSILDGSVVIETEHDTGIEIRQSFP